MILATSTQRAFGFVILAVVAIGFVVWFFANLRAYHVIAELNTKPQVTYFTKLRNRPLRDSDHAGGHGEASHDGGNHS